MENIQSDFYGETHASGLDPMILAIFGALSRFTESDSYKAQVLWSALNCITGVHEVCEKLSVEPSCLVFNQDVN